MGPLDGVYDDLHRLWDKLLFNDGDPAMERTALLLGAVEALVVFTLIPKSGGGGPPDACDGDIGA